MVNSSLTSALNSQRARYRWWYRFTLCAKVVTTEVWLTVMGRSSLERKAAKTAHAQWEEQWMHLFSWTLCIIFFAQMLYFLNFSREVKLYVHSGDAQLCRAHTLLWMAAHAGFVMAAAFMGEAVSMENNSPILTTAASSALVRYHHAAVLITD